MTAVSRSITKIWVVPAGTAASSLVTTSPFAKDTNELGYVAGETKSYSKSGGETDVESEAVFGGFIDKEKPQTQFEVGFEIVPSVEASGLWEEMVYGEDTATGVLSSAAAIPGNRAVYIEAIRPDGSFASGWGFNECSVTVLDQEHNADDNQSQNLTLKFSPTTEGGVANFIFNSTARDANFDSITELPSWSSLDNN
jgi:hypothetical protein